MSTTKLIDFGSDNHPPASGIAGSEKPDFISLRAAVFAAIGKIAGDEGERDDLTDGGRHEFALTVGGEIDGHDFSQSFSGSLSVGHASTRASSVGPNQDHLLAYVLGKLNAKTRDKILRDTAAEFAAAGELPAMADEAVEAAKKFRGELRQKVAQSVRGSVRVEYAAKPGETTLPTLRVSAAG